MNMRMRWLAVGVFMVANGAVAGFLEGPIQPRELGRKTTPAGIQFVGFKMLNPEAETAALTPSRKQPHVVAYCVLPGAKDRFVITSEAQLVQITQAGVATVIGVVIAPVSSEFLCMIKTEKTLIGVNGSGHLVNTENGSVVGAVVPIDEKEEEPAKQPDPVSP
ncbi:MAG: hypothetical protein JWL59_4511 [Chthoniobacteraceae bacterium]|nr:hypothetical protein [Chthoniobacteraceae bacterium]